jgi:hypothetical protein
MRDEETFTVDMAWLRREFAAALRSYFAPVTSLLRCLGFLHSR